MRRLSGIDADMLYGETPTWHMQVAGLLVLDGGKGFGYDHVRRLIAAQVSRSAAFRERLVAVPFGLDRPYWVLDGAFDLDAHVRRVEVPAPGGRREVARVVGSLVAQKLDRRRPLWEMSVLEGLEDGTVAVLGKVHHAVADGVGGALLMGGLFSAEPSPVPGEPDGFPAGERVPTSPELLLGAAASIAGLPWRTGRAAVRTARAARKVGRLRRAGTTRSAALPFRCPRTSFNRPVTANRSVAFVSVPLATVKQVKRLAGATVNDVVLVLCAGALRRYLEERHELPASSLVAAVPVSVRRPDQLGTFGNQVSGWFASLATDVDDPSRRLQLVRDAAAGAKGLYESGAEDVVMDWADLPPPALWSLGVRLYTGLRVSERMPPIFNLLVSNVPGAPFPLYAGPARLLATYPFGPVLDGIGLNVTVLSYQESVDFGILTCPELIPDPWRLADGVPDALDELVAAVGATV